MLLVKPLLQEQLIQASRLDDARRVVFLDDPQRQLEAMRHADWFTFQLEAERIIEQDSSPGHHIPALPSDFRLPHAHHRSSMGRISPAVPPPQSSSWLR